MAKKIEAYECEKCGRVYKDLITAEVHEKIFSNVEPLPKGLIVKERQEPNQEWYGIIGDTFYTYLQEDDKHISHSELYWVARIIGGKLNIFRVMGADGNTSLIRRIKEGGLQFLSNDEFNKVKTLLIENKDKFEEYGFNLNPEDLFNTSPKLEERLRGE